MNSLLARVGERLARYLTRPREGNAGPPVCTDENWQEHLRPCDVLLVEGSSRIATAIKYLTQSTWSHAALYVGDVGVRSDGGEPATLIEADVQEGVRVVPLSLYAGANVRICRPARMTTGDRTRVVEFACEAIGRRYDLRNVFDLMRYLLPEPPIPARWRRRLIELGSGEPTRAICSTLIAQAFQSVRYPILPEPRIENEGPMRYQVRHHSFMTPRDFDLSPFFSVIKPTLEAGFDYRRFPWVAEPD